MEREEKIMEKDTIITLEDNEKYVLLDKVELENANYFLALKLTEDEQPTKEYEIFEEEIEDGESYMITLEDGDFKQAILIDFTNNYMHMVGELVEETE